MIDGTTDRLFPATLHPDAHIGAAIGAAAVREETDNAYLANDHSTFALNGARRCADRLRTGSERIGEGGLVLTAVAVDESRGLVYVTNDDAEEQVTVVRDGRVACRPAAPPFRLGVASSQAALRDGLTAVVSCPSVPCTATANATVSVPGAARTFRLRRARRSIGAGRRARLVMRMPARARGAVRRALSRGTRVRARVTVVVSGQNGGRATRRRTVRLRP